MQIVCSVFKEYNSIYGSTKLLRELQGRSVEINEYKLGKSNGVFAPKPVLARKFQLKKELIYRRIYADIDEIQEETFA